MPPAARAARQEKECQPETACLRFLNYSTMVEHGMAPRCSANLPTPEMLNQMRIRIRIRKEWVWTSSIKADGVRGAAEAARVLPGVMNFRDGVIAESGKALSPAGDAAASWSLGSAS